MVKSLISSSGKILFFLGIILFVFDMIWGFWDHDSGFFLLQSFMVSKGLRPYVDYQALYPPFMFIIQAIPIWVGMTREAITLLSPVFWVGGIALLTVLYIQNESERETAIKSINYSWFFGAFYFLFCIEFGGNHLTLEHGVVFCSLMALHLGGRSLSVGGLMLRQILVGVFIGSAILVKQVGIVLVLPFLIRAVHVRALAGYISGIVMPFCLVLIWIGEKPSKLIEGQAVLLRYLAPSKPEGFDALFGGLIYVLQSELFRTPIGLFSILFTTLVGLYFSIRAHRDRDIYRSLWLASWVLVLVLFFAARAKNNFPHYTLNCWPAFVTIIPESYPFFSGLAKKAWLKLVIFSLVALVAFHLKFPIRTIDGKNYFLRWQGGGRLTTFLFPVARELDRLIPANASITHMGFEESVLFFLAGRIPLNKDWSPHNIRAKIEGDYLLINHMDESWASGESDVIFAKGFRRIKAWYHPEGSIELYKNIEL